MFKERRFLAGFGIGIIAGGLLLQLMLTGQESPVLPDSEERLYTEQEVQQLVEKAKLEANEQPDAASPKSKTEDQEKGPAAPNSPELPAAANAAKEPSQPAAPTEAAAQPTNAAEPPQSNSPEPTAASEPAPVAAQEAVPIVIRIKPGMNLTDTAKLLADNGLIDSPSKFISTMKDENKLVRAGYFAFTGKQTLEQTIDTLTGQPLTGQEADRMKSKS